MLINASAWSPPAPSSDTTDVGIWPVSNWKCNRCRHHRLPSWWARPRVTFFSIDDFTPHFIEINGNPSFFMLLIAPEHRYYDNTQINKIIKITHKIDLLTSHVVSPWKILSSQSHSTTSIFVKSSASIWLITPSMSPDNSQLCKHSTDSTDSVESWFRQSLNVKLGGIVKDIENYGCGR